MDKNKMMEEARAIINSNENDKLRTLLYGIHQENFGAMTASQYTSETVVELNPVEAFNSGIEAGKYAMLFELLTGLGMNPLEETEEVLLKELNYKMMEPAMLGAEKMIFDLYDLIEDFVDARINLANPHEKARYLASLTALKANLKRILPEDKYNSLKESHELRSNAFDGKMVKDISDNFEKDFPSFETFLKSMGLPDSLIDGLISAKKDVEEKHGLGVPDSFADYLQKMHEGPGTPEENLKSNITEKVKEFQKMFGLKVTGSSKDFMNSIYGKEGIDLHKFISEMKGDLPFNMSPFNLDSDSGLDHLSKLKELFPNASFHILKNNQDKTNN